MQGASSDGKAGGDVVSWRQQTGKGYTNDGIGVSAQRQAAAGRLGHGALAEISDGGGALRRRGTAAVLPGLWGAACACGGHAGPGQSRLAADPWGSGSRPGLPACVGRTAGAAVDRHGIASGPGTSAGGEGRSARHGSGEPDDPGGGRNLPGRIGSGAADGQPVGRPVRDPVFPGAQDRGAYAFLGGGGSGPPGGSGPGGPASGLLLSGAVLREPPWGGAAGAGPGVYGGSGDHRRTVRGPPVAVLASAPPVAAAGDPGVHPGHMPRQKLEHRSLAWGEHGRALRSLPHLGEFPLGLLRGPGPAGAGGPDSF